MGIIWIIAAAGWGLAEATFFFIVPDVLLTLATIRLGLRAGLRLAIAAAAASLAGLAMWAWGYCDAVSARGAMLWIPAIGPDLLARARQEIAGNWPLHLFTGAMTGLPYKLYAVEAGAHGINPVLFALVSFPARLTRFLLTVVLAAAARETAAALRRPRWSYLAWAIGWIALYAFYFGARAAA